MYKTLQKHLKEVRKQITQIEKNVKKYPKEQIRCYKNNGSVRWYKIGKGKRDYIPTSELSKAQELANGTYLFCKLDDLRYEERYLSNFLGCMSRHKSKVQKYFKSHMYMDLVTLFKPISEELEEWAKEEYVKSSEFPDDLKHKCLSGNIVRSKSESFIDQALFLRGIPYRYECELQLGDVSFYPDFTIRHPITGKTYYWEHFGMMGNNEYMIKMQRKLARYIANGIIPGENLIMTFESKDNPLSIELVEMMVSHYFGVDSREIAV